MSVHDEVMTLAGPPLWEWEPEPAAADGPALDRVLTPAEERRLRRMVSNRESARRSRMRKQRHLEDLRCQANRLRSENRDLANRVGAVSHYCVLIRRDNDRLRSESSALRRRLSEIRRVLLLRQITAPTFSPASIAAAAAAAFGGGGFVTGNELNHPSLIV